MDEQSMGSEAKDEQEIASLDYIRDAINFDIDDYIDDSDIEIDERN